MPPKQKADCVRCGVANPVRDLVVNQRNEIICPECLTLEDEGEEFEIVREYYNV